MLLTQQAFEWSTATWEKGYEAVQQFTDKLGCFVDEGIMETVVALNLLGFRTSQSCQGHLDHGKPYSWVDFETEGCYGYEQAQEDACRDGLSAEEEDAACDRLMALVSAFHHKNHLYTQLQAFLDAYYEGKEDTSEDWRIIVHCYHPGWYRLFSACAYEAEEWSQADRTKNLARCQAEMQQFGNFLKQYWTEKREIILLSVA